MKNSKSTTKLFRAMQKFAHQLRIWEGEELLSEVFARFLANLVKESEAQLLQQCHFYAGNFGENHLNQQLVAEVAKTLGPDHAKVLRKFAKAVCKLA